MAAADGARIAHLHPKVLMPLSKKKIGAFLKPLKKVIVFEENHTRQFATYLKSQFSVNTIDVNKCSGLPFSGDEVLAALKEHV
jgi:2-oxoglutarate ferredoxin oxidoreductase subunit alpha